jgi:hypothetical protein
MSEDHNIVLREGEGDNPPDLLKQMLTELAAEIALGLPEAASSGRRYLAGKAEQQTARAQFIRAAAAAKIAEVQLQRDRLIEEREKALREHEVRVYEAATERIRALADAGKFIQALRDIGVEIDLDILLPSAVRERITKPGDPTEGGSP